MTVYDFFDFERGINLFTYCVDWNEPDCFYFLRNFLTVQYVCEKRIFLQAVRAGESLFRISSILCESLIECVAESFACYCGYFVRIKVAPNLFIFAVILQYLSVNGFVVKLAPGGQLDFFFISAFTFCLIGIAGYYLVLGLD